jgi:pimeloyl-ACP methyl ester carboxylesterase
MRWIYALLSARLCISAAITARMSTTTNTISFNNSTVSYQQYGVGPDALVFGHGWTCAGALWKDQAPLFQQFRSLVIDLPGHGKSEAPVIEYSREYFAKALKAVVDDAHVEKVILVGHSMGGPVSTTFLQLFSEQVSGIIYVDSFFNLPENYFTQTERKQLSYKLNNDTAFVETVKTFFSPRATADIQSLVIETMAGTAKHVRTNATTTDLLPPPFRWNDVYKIPALHIVTPRFADIDQAWLRHLPGLETREWTDYGHFLFMEDPLRFNSEVEAFVIKNNLL